MASCTRLGPRRAGPLTAAVVLVRADAPECADVLVRADVPACAAVLALVAAAVATDAVIAVQAAMRPAANKRLPRRFFVTGRE